MTRNSLCLLALVLLSTVARAQDVFPEPPELKPDIEFWVNIFSRYDSGEGVLHDNRHLGVVYERIDLSAKMARRERQRRVQRRREALQTMLRSLASGKRDNLTAEEARILALWPDDVTNDTLRSAVGRIRYQQGLSDRFRQGLSRSGRWRTHVESEFDALGVPRDLAALPHVESSYNPDARSHVGASGIWQFTRSTGRRFMQVDHVLDERNDPFIATTSAGQLLAYNYSITGNWPMAITAYNHGLSGVRRAMRRHGDTAYVDILRKYNGRTFGFASRNFYVAFLAARRIDLSPDKYFPGIKFEAAIDYATATLPAYVAADDLGAALGVTSKTLARSNPALQATIWQGSKHIPKGYELRIPTASIDGSIDSLLDGIDGDSWHNEQLPDLFHTVRRGDTLSQIAEAYKTRVSTLVALNTLSSSHRIRIGQRLRLPAAGPAPGEVTVARTEPPAPVQADAPAAAPVDVGQAVEEIEPAPLSGDLTASLLGTLQTALLSDPSDYTVADDNTIEVHPQETLGHYGDWLGIKTQRLRDANGLAFRTPVVVGQRIRLVIEDVDAETFEARRIAYHRTQQDGFFRKHVITGIAEHKIKSGESIWILSLRKYDVPIWLFRQYNPDVDLHKVQPGITVRFPVMTVVERS